VETPDAVEKVLMFLYTGKIENMDYNELQEVLEVADYLQYDDLKDVLETYLSSNIEPCMHTCVAMTVCAQNHGLQKTFSLFYNWMMYHFLDILKSSSRFDVSPGLMETIMNEDQLGCCPRSRLVEFLLQWTDHDQMMRERYFEQLFMALDLVELDVTGLEMLENHSYVKNSEMCTRKCEELRKQFEEAISIKGGEKDAMGKKDVMFVCSSQKLHSELQDADHLNIEALDVRTKTWYRVAKCSKPLPKSDSPPEICGTFCYTDNSLIVHVKTVLPIFHTIDFEVCTFGDEFQMQTHSLSLPPRLMVPMYSSVMVTDMFFSIKTDLLYLIVSAKRGSASKTYDYLLIVTDKNAHSVLEALKIPLLCYIDANRHKIMTCLVNDEWLCFVKDERVGNLDGSFVHHHDFLYADVYTLRFKHDDMSAVQLGPIDVIEGITAKDGKAMLYFFVEPLSSFFSCSRKCFEFDINTKTWEGSSIADNERYRLNNFCEINDKIFTIQYKMIHVYNRTDGTTSQVRLPYSMSNAAMVKARVPFDLLQRLWLYRMAARKLE